MLEQDTGLDTVALVADIEKLGSDLRAGTQSGTDIAAGLQYLSLIAGDAAVATAANATASSAIGASLAADQALLAVLQSDASSGSIILTGTIETLAGVVTGTGAISAAAVAADLATIQLAAAATAPLAIAAVRAGLTASGEAYIALSKNFAVASDVINATAALTSASSLSTYALIHGDIQAINADLGLPQSSVLSNLVDDSIGALSVLGGSQLLSDADRPQGLSDIQAGLNAQGESLLLLSEAVDAATSLRFVSAAVDTYRSVVLHTEAVADLTSSAAVGVYADVAKDQQAIIGAVLERAGDPEAEDRFVSASTDAIETVTSALQTVHSVNQRIETVLNAIDPTTSPAFVEGSAIAKDVVTLARSAAQLADDFDTLSSDGASLGAFTDSLASIVDDLKAYRGAQDALLKDIGAAASASGTSASASGGASGMSSGAEVPAQDSAAALAIGALLSKPMSENTISLADIS